MIIEAYIGMQAGDEGKGIFVARRVLILVEEAKLRGKKALNYRYGGGANAGHCVGLENEKYALHQMPSGIVFAKWNLPISTLIGTDCYVDPRKLVNEINELRERGIPINPENFMIASDSVMTLDYHNWESMSSYGNGDKNWSSTGTGNQPTAVDKARRKPSIRFAEFLDVDSFKRILEENDSLERILSIRNKEGISLYTGYNDFIDSYKKIIDELSLFKVLESDLFNNPEFIYGIAEGAQGADLDQSIGMVPGTTGSNPSRPTHRPDIIRGVFKAYESSVGTADRPFISRMPLELESMCREPWKERGTTTQRDREIGWFDAVKGRYRVEGTDVDEILLTCLDRMEFLGNIGCPIEVVVGYECDGKKYNRWDADFSNRYMLRRLKPITEKLDPWTRTTENDGKTLTPNAERYVNFLEEKLGKRFSAIGIGPDVKDVIIRH